MSFEGAPAGGTQRAAPGRMPARRDGTRVTSCDRAHAGAPPRQRRQRGQASACGPAGAPQPRPRAWPPHLRYAAAGAEQQERRGGGARALSRRAWPLHGRWAATATASLYSSHSFHPTALRPARPVRQAAVGAELRGGGPASGVQPELLQGGVGLCSMFNPRFKSLEHPRAAFYPACGCVWRASTVGAAPRGPAAPSGWTCRSTALLRGKAKLEREPAPLARAGSLRRHGPCCRRALTGAPRAPRRPLLPSTTRDRRLGHSDNLLSSDGSRGMAAIEAVISDGGGGHGHEMRWPRQCRKEVGHAPQLDNGRVRLWYCAG